MFLAMSIALWLRAVRKERGWSTYKMARIVGVSEPSVVLWEQERRRPSVPSCVKIARATDTPIQEVVLMAMLGDGDGFSGADRT